MEISENASSGRLQEFKNIKKSLKFKAQKVVAVAHRRWSFIRGSSRKALTGKVLVSWSGRVYANSLVSCGLIGIKKVCGIRIRGLSFRGMLT